MAPDLIPPPSPAGRPAADGAAEDRVDEALEAAAQPPRQDTPAAASPAPFRGRFGFLWGALAGTAVCATAVTVLLATTGRDTGPPLAENWSGWKPGTTRMVDGAADIAAHVQREYKLNSGDQLVNVRSGAIELQGLPLGVAIRPKGGELEMLEGDGLLYVLLGLEPGGTLPGKPNKARGRLLMREALELSLYSFRYLDDVTMVGVMLPPSSQGDSKTDTSAAQQTRVVFYRPGDLLPQLQVPLDATLPAKAPPPNELGEAETAKIESLTLRNLFLASIQPLQSDLSYLVLTAPDKIE
jgi:hypothetical protein